MLRPKALEYLLSRANTAGIQCTFLMNTEGVILSYSNSLEENNKDCLSVKAAITSNVWNAYEKNGQIFLNEDNLKTLLIQYENGKLIITKIADYLLFMQANHTTEFGFLKLNAEALAKSLEEPMKQVSLA